MNGRNSSTPEPWGGLRVAFVLHWPQPPTGGVAGKVLAQVRTWAELGAQSALFVATTPEHRDAWLATDHVAAVETGPVDAPGLRAQADLWRVQRRLLSLVARWEPEVLYHRQTIYYPGLRAAARRVPLVVEVNGREVVELAEGAPRKNQLNRATRGRYLSVAAALIPVTEELAMVPENRRYGRPYAVVGNSIDMSQLDPLPATRGDRARLALVGSPDMPWHGADVFARLAEVRPEWDFDLIGPEGPADPPSNLTVHGSRSGIELTQLLAAADVGVGTLALHRKGLEEAAPLKTRHYLGLGLPVIGGYKDSGITPGADYFLQVPNSADGVFDRMRDVVSFVDSWKGRRVPRSRVSYLDIVPVERRRLEVLAGVARRSVDCFTVSPEVQL